MERLGLWDAFLSDGKVQGAGSALGAAYGPGFLLEKKFFPQYPNESEQQKGK